MLKSQQKYQNENTYHLKKGSKLFMNLDWFEYVINLEQKMVWEECCM